ncbi:MAG: pirin family protein [Acidobacteria bacterium]|nr:pirin family protein [Acidobacteriota bacterium]
MKVRASNERGRTEIDWLDSYHSFSFNYYHDPQHIHFRSLRVINEDYVKAGAGFAPHSHQNMEIITYILSGELAHKDSLGNGSTIKPGEIQRMSAGTGITHSEYNASQTNLVHLLQIWIIPEKKGIEPGYEQKAINLTNGQWQLIASKDATETVVKIHQDTDLFVTKLLANQSISYKVSPNRYVWIQIAKGSVFLNDKLLDQGDGVAISEETDLTFLAKTDSEILLFDLA